MMPVRPAKCVRCVCPHPPRPKMANFDQRSRVYRRDVLSESKRNFLFTSESVTEGHPDKIADQISDAVLDEVMKQDPKGRVACETLVTTGLAVVAGEITTTAHIDYDQLVRDTIRGVGYDRAKYGYDADTCAVMCT